MSWLLVVAGVAVVAVALVDVFLVVLYLRGGIGLVTPLLSSLIWLGFRGLSRLLPVARGRVLSFTGPVVLLATAAAWGLLVLLGCALATWPSLGGAVVASSGATPTGFAAALYYAAMCLTTLGTGDLVPTTATARLAMVAMAGLGFSLLTLVATYFLSIYSALLRRNTFAIDLHHRTASTGDAVAYLVRAGADGNPSSVVSDLREMSQELVRLYESHQFYPLLHYFRYPEERYALARIGLVALDTYSLIRTALDREAYPTLVRGSATRGLGEVGRDVLSELGRQFLPSQGPPWPPEDEARIRRWRERYRDARRRLAREGVRLAPAEEGEEAYLELRREWQPWIDAFARRLDYDLEAIEAGEGREATDPAGDEREATEPSAEERVEG